MNVPTRDIYSRPPSGDRDGIPIFSPPDDYSRNYDSIARVHLEALAEHGINPFFRETVWRDMENSTVELVRRYAQPGCRILDVGVGLGRLLAHFPNLDRYGADISLDYLVHARKCGIDVCCARAEDLPYHTDFFDIIVATDVLEHVLGLDAAIARLKALLKPNGLLIIRVPDREDMWQYVDPSYPFDFAHVRRFDEPGLRLLLGKIFGFEFVERRYVYGHSSLKLRLPLPRPLSRAAMGVLYYSTMKFTALRRLTARLFFSPLEISMVVRKPASAQPTSNRHAG